MNLFEHLNNLCYDKKKWEDLSEEDRKTANVYMINRFLSHEYNYIDIINEVQKLNLPIKYLYNLYIGVIPKQKKYLKYIKKTVKETKGTELDIIRKVFEVSEREAKEYMSKLDTKQIESLRVQVEGFKQKKKK
jgi:hypothetical protein